MERGKGDEASQCALFSFGQSIREGVSYANIP